MKAQRHPMTDLRPETRDRVHRARVETLRAAGRYRELCLWLLGAPDAWQDDGAGRSRAVRSRPDVEPAREDLIAAYDESSDPLPAPIVAHIVQHYVKGLPLKTGPKAPARSIGDDDRVFDLYLRALFDALDAHEANDGPATRAVVTRAKTQTATQCGISTGTIERILAARQLLKDPPK